jgi:hypothetical protein
LRCVFEGSGTKHPKKKKEIILNGNVEKQAGTKRLYGGEVKIGEN